MDKFLRKESVQYVPPGKILSYLTGDLLKETPEEHIRQRFLRSLVEEYGYNLSQIRINFKISVGSKRLPVDIAIFYDGTSILQENIYLIAETKRPEIQITDKDNGIGQLQSYISSSINCQFGVWTNGEDKQCLLKRKSKSNGNEKYEIVEVLDIPLHGKTLDESEKPDFSQLRPATELKSVFRRINDYIYSRQGMREDDAFKELLKLIFCKVYDERSDNIQFHVTNREMNSDIGQIEVKKRIQKLFDSVKNQYQYIFKSQPQILLNARVLCYVVAQLQNYYLLRTDTDVKGEAYEVIVGKNLRGNLGEYFTPRNVCKLAVKLLFTIYGSWRSHYPKIIDPACGTGGFLISVIDFMRDKYTKREINKGLSYEQALQIVDDEIRVFCSNSLYGIDFNEVIIQAAQMNEVIHGNGSSNLFSVDSLMAPGEWSSEISQQVKLGMFDMLLTNPPFGDKIPIDDRHLLSQYDLGHIWREDANENLIKTNDIRSTVPPQVLFIERSVQLLKPGGILAIVVPDSILSNPGWKHARQWIMANTKIIASVDLAKETFAPSTATKTSLLVLERKRPQEIELENTGGKLPDYEIFMAIASKVGRNSRGEKIYRRTPDGEIIEIEKEKQIVKLHNKTKIRETILVKEPVEDDDLPQIGDEFSEWWNKRNK